MQKIFIMILLLLSPATVSVAANSSDAVATTSLGSPESTDTTLVECFVSINAESCVSTPNSILLNWWQWSDETKSNWPDDDAKARAGELLIDTPPNQSTRIINEETEIDLALSNRDNFTAKLPVIQLTGELALHNDVDGHRIEMPVAMTPLVNLSDSTILYIYLSQATATDDHSRKLSNLVYEMKPEIGFSNQANNTTETTWLIADSHLAAAGVDFEESPYGWSVTFAMFGKIEGYDTNQLLYLNQVELATQPQNVDFDQFLVPLFVIIFAIIVIVTILSNMHKEEHGMPIITGYWHHSKTNCLVVEFTTKQQRMEIKSLEVDAPWRLSSRFKSRFIEANKSITVELKFKQSESAECRLHIRLDVDELGVWTQYLAIASNLAD